MTQPSRFLTIANPALALLVEVDTAITGHAAVFISDGTDTVQVDPAHLAKLTAALVEAQQAIAGGTDPKCRYCRSSLTDDQERGWGMCGHCYDSGRAA